MFAAKGFLVEGKPKTKPKIISAARDMLQAANNDVSNLFVGDACINSVSQESLRPRRQGQSASDAEAVAQREAYAEKMGLPGRRVRHHYRTPVQAPRHHPPDRDHHPTSTQRACPRSRQ